MKKAILIALVFAGALVVACDNDEVDLGNRPVVVCDDQPGTYCGGDHPVRRP